MDKLCIREIRVIRVRCKNQLVLCFVGALHAWLVHLRQVHPLRHPLKVSV